MTLLSANNEIEEIRKSIQQIRYLIQKIIRGTENITEKIEPALASTEEVLIDAKSAVNNASNIFVEFSNYNFPINRTYITLIFLFEFISFGIILFLVYKIIKNLKKLFKQIDDKIEERRTYINKNNLREFEIPLLKNEQK
ncbi:hypothetical protein Mgra_00008382 [Meloidogyne graminicola]|uniref:Uncharacterized protein n=1 Tax=Meloidogyne graminicola TaxID=189291 RepID=A0A8S9ZFV7_9BILA|nr:hypothetical protein Mgra_00008382 [Meloidogyne graminicola]